MKIEIYGAGPEAIVRLFNAEGELIAKMTMAEWSFAIANPAVAS